MQKQTRIEKAIKNRIEILLSVKQQINGLPEMIDTLNLIMNIKAIEGTNQSKKRLKDLEELLSITDAYIEQLKKEYIL